MASTLNRSPEAFRCKACVLLVCAFSVLILSSAVLADIPTVELLRSPAPPNSHLSRVTSDGEGNVFLSWVAERDGIAELAFAEFTGGSWSDGQTITEGSDWFINWADFPALSVGSGTRVAHWLQRSATGTYDYDVAARFYSGASGAWSQPRILHSDGVSAEHGFVAMTPMGSGHTLISWLDGRNTKDQPTPGPMTLRAGIYGPAGKTLNEWELDPAVCDCCTTSAAMTSEGPVVVYRDRTAEEIRDIAITRLVNEQWTKPKIVHADSWRITGCPVNGPAVAARGSKVAVAWFTARDATPKVQPSARWTDLTLAWSGWPRPTAFPCMPG